MNASFSRSVSAPDSVAASGDPAGQAAGTATPLLARTGPSGVPVRLGSNQVRRQHTARGLLPVLIGNAIPLRDALGWIAGYRDQRAGGAYERAERCEADQEQAHGLATLKGEKC